MDGYEDNSIIQSYCFNISDSEILMMQFQGVMIFGIISTLLLLVTLILQIFFLPVQVYISIPPIPLHNSCFDASRYNQQFIPEKFRLSFVFVTFD